MLRRYSTKASKSPVATRFPTKYNPVRSAWKQKILLPENLVHNPAPTAPCPLETPAVFLPKNDNRKRIEKIYNIDQMPIYGGKNASTYHLSTEDFLEIQKLRLENPEKWTRKCLASHFKVSEYVIGLASEPHPDRVKEMEKRLQIIKDSWHEKKIRARQHRQVRRLFWLADA